MPIALSDQMSLALDVAILLRRNHDVAQDAVLDRKLIDLLLAIEDTNSVAKACERLCCSTRYAQRMIKRFSDASGLELLKHRGWQGTELTDEAHQCIALYVATRSCTEQIVMTNDFPRALPALNQFPNKHDWNHRDL